MRYAEPTNEQLAAWKAWLAERPENVRCIGERLDPWTLYRMKSTNQRVTIAAIAENATVRVNVTGEFNLIGFERSVFGVDPDDLVECDLPGDDEDLGTLDLTEAEAKELMQLDSARRDERMLMYAVAGRKIRTYPRNWKTRSLS